MAMRHWIHPESSSVNAKAKEKKKLKQAMNPLEIDSRS